MRQISGRKALRLFVQRNRKRTKNQRGGLECGERPRDLHGGHYTLLAVSGQGPSQGAHKPLPGKVRSPSWHGVVADVDQAAGLQVPVDEAAQGPPDRFAHPRVNAVRDDVVEAGIVGFNRRIEVQCVETDVRNARVRRETPRKTDVLLHRVDAAKDAGRMCRSQNRGRHAIAAAKVAPCERVFTVRRHKPANQRHVVQPRGGQFANEITDIRDVGDVPVDMPMVIQFLSPGLASIGPCPRLYMVARTCDAFRFRINQLDGSGLRLFRRVVCL